MILVAALVLAVSRFFLGKFDLEALFNFFFDIIKVLIICILSYIVLDRRHRLRLRSIYDF